MITIEADLHRQKRQANPEKRQANKPLIGRKVWIHALHRSGSPE